MPYLDLTLKTQCSAFNASDRALQDEGDQLRALDNTGQELSSPLLLLLLKLSRVINAGYRTINKIGTM